MANVDVRTVEKIRELISKAELENAKNSVVIENIEKEWIEKYGISDVSKITAKLDELKSDLNNSNERLKKVYNELISAQNWEELEEELS